MRFGHVLFSAAALVVLLAPAGCNLIWGLHHATRDTSTTSTQSGGAGGVGGGAISCTPGETKACYEGPSGTEGVAQCRGGQATCHADGTGFGPCDGQVLPAAETCGDVADENCDALDCVQWSSLLGNLSVQVGGGIAVDSFGNSFVAGSFVGAIPLPTGTLTAQVTTAYLVKLDSTGHVLWGKSFGGIGNGVTQGLAVAVDSKGDVAIAGVAQDVIKFDQEMIGPGAYVAKLDGAGLPLWSIALTSGAKAGDEASALAFSASDDVIVGGSFISPIDFGDGQVAGPSGASPYAFVAKLNGSTGSGKTGDGGWGRVLCTGSSTCRAPAVAGDIEGAVFVAGSFQGTMSLGTAASLTALGTTDAFFGKITFDGEPVWLMQLGGADSVVAVAPGQLSVGPSGAPSLGGLFLGSVDFGNGAAVKSDDGAGFVARYDEYGAYEGCAVLATGSPHALATNSTGDIFVAGNFAGTLDLGIGSMTSTGGNDIFVAKVAKNGNVLWNKSFGSEGDAGNQAVSAMALTVQGDPVVVGSTDGPVDFGAGKMTPAGKWDVFVARLSQ